MAYGKVIVMCCDAVREMMKEFEKIQYNNNIMDLDVKTGKEEAFLAS